jgi:2-methylisocitrate lyase-like PEP mutase family enzyme
LEDGFRINYLPDQFCDAKHVQAYGFPTVEMALRHRFPHAREVRNLLEPAIERGYISDDSFSHIENVAIHSKTLREGNVMSTKGPGVSSKRQDFWKLHQSGCFVLPNPWDIGSAKYLQSLGFKALATTSSGLAWTHARPDNSLDRETVLTHLSELVDATEVPINADFESGFGANTTQVEESVRLAIETGVAGISIEDSTGMAGDPIYSIDEACKRLRAARRAIDKAGGDVMLIGRAECFFVGRPDLAETIARLKAYSQIGADCLYAPGIRTRHEIEAVVAAVHPKPVNLLVGSASDMTISDIAKLGVRRVSVGGGLARVAWGGMMRAARLLADEGRFDGFADAAAGSEMNALFKISNNT